MSVTRYADVRYAGQAYELTVLVPPGAVDVERLVEDFVAEHVRTYGHGSADDPRRRRLGAGARPRRADGGPAVRPARRDPRAPRRRGLAALPTSAPAAGTVETPVCNRAGLLGGERAGPLLVDEDDSTCVVPPGCTARLDGHGNIEVDVGA